MKIERALIHNGRNYELFFETIATIFENDKYFY